MASGLSSARTTRAAWASLFAERKRSLECLQGGHEASKLGHKCSEGGVLRSPVVALGEGMKGSLKAPPVALHGHHGVGEPRRELGRVGPLLDDEAGRVALIL